MTSDSLYVRLLKARYLMPTDHPDPAALRHRMDDIITAYLKEALDSTLAPTEDALWFIRRLDVDLSMKTTWPPEVAARVWADSISRAVAAVQRAGVLNENVVRFDNRADYLAQFLVDLVEDAAWSRWYYHEFAGLNYLNESSAIRTVIGREPETAIEGLSRLPGHKSQRITDALSEADARNLFRALHSVPIGDAPNLRFIWRCIEEREFYSLGWTGDKAALAILVEFERRGYRFKYSSVWKLTRAVFTLKDIFRVGTVSPVSIRSAILDNVPAYLYQLLTPVEAENLAPLWECRAEEINEVFAALERLSSQLTRAAKPDRDHQSWARSDVYTSQFGGIFLLLPFLDSLELHKVSYLWDTDRTEHPISAEPMLRILIISMCLGGKSLPDLVLDSAVRIVLGINHTVSLKSIVEWYENVTIVQKRELCKHLVAQARRQRYGARQLGKSDCEHLEFSESFADLPSDMRSIGLAARMVMTAFANRLSGFSKSSFPYLYQNFLLCSAVVEVGDDRIVATLSRPPLDVILNMTGMSRTAYKLPWLTQQVAVYPASA